MTTTTTTATTATNNSNNQQQQTTATTATTTVTATIRNKSKTAQTKTLVRITQGGNELKKNEKRKTINTHVT